MWDSGVNGLCYIWIQKIKINNLSNIESSLLEHKICFNWNMVLDDNYLNYENIQNASMKLAMNMIP